MQSAEKKSNIKYSVRKYISAYAEKFKGKRVVDFPAGNGFASELISEVGGEPIAMDLFPEYFKFSGATCQRASMNDGLPLDDNSVDHFICQEGIEHFSDQLFAFKEFSRVLKKEGSLLITTPNYSSLRSKFSYLMSESERYGKKMPPNEIDSIWMSQQSITNEIYYGHIFLVGIQKLRLFGKIAGFDLIKVHRIPARLNSVLLFIVFYPLILLTNWRAYRRNLKRNKQYDKAELRKVYREQLRLAINPRILTSGHLMVEFIKKRDVKEVAGFLSGKHTEFGST